MERTRRGKRLSDERSGDGTGDSDSRLRGLSRVDKNPPHEGSMERLILPPLRLIRPVTSLLWPKGGKGRSEEDQGMYGRGHVGSGACDQPVATPGTTDRSGRGNGQPPSGELAMPPVDRPSVVSL